MKTLKVSQRVIRSQGDYVVGRVGVIIEIDGIKNRARVEWDEAPKSWVSFGSLELESIPYKIIPYTYNEKTGKHTYQKYQKI